VAIRQHLHSLQENAAKDLYPTDLSGCLTEESPYFDEHIRINTEEQLRAIEQAELYAVQPEQWYTKQLPIDFETSRAWCERFRVPYSQKHPMAINPSS
jgi:hypothetical protein